jgi:hypothetical protein
MQGGRQPTGWYCSSGVSVFSFKGVYRAPMGTTRRDASCSSGQRCVLSTPAGGPYHARAGERVPAEADAIAVLDVAPLVLERFKVGHLVLVLACSRGRGLVARSAPTLRIGGAVRAGASGGSAGRSETGEAVQITTWPLPRLSQGCSKGLRCYVPRPVAALRCGQIPRSNIPGASVPIGPSSAQAPSSLKTADFRAAPFVSSSPPANKTLLNGRLDTQ